MWIKCADRMPPEFEDILFVTHPNVVLSGYFATTAQGFMDWRWKSKYSPQVVTHWQPMPEPPKENE